MPTLAPPSREPRHQLVETRMSTAGHMGQEGPGTGGSALHRLRGIPRIPQETPGAFELPPRRSLCKLKECSLQICHQTLPAARPFDATAGPQGTMLSPAVPPRWQQHLTRELLHPTPRVCPQRLGKAHTHMTATGASPKGQSSTLSPRAACHTRLRAHAPSPAPQASPAWSHALVTVVQRGPPCPGLAGPSATIAQQAMLSQQGWGGLSGAAPGVGEAEALQGCGALEKEQTGRDSLSPVGTGHPRPWAWLGLHSQHLLLLASHFAGKPSATPFLTAHPMGRCLHLVHQVRHLSVAFTPGEEGREGVKAERGHTTESRTHACQRDGEEKQ